jgi:deoxyribonuclease-4
MAESPKFGPGGNSESFYQSGFKATVQAPEWLRSIGLDAYEYQAGNGLTAGLPTLSAIGEKAQENGIAMSLHTPYFISLASAEEEKRLKSIDYIRRSLTAAAALHADTIVIHCGGVAKMTRDEGMTLSKDTLSRLLTELPADLPIRLGLETMGKINQLGTLEEVIELVCRNDASATSELKRRHNMHTLKGSWLGSHECHVANAGDWLLIWRSSDTVAAFQRTGSHDELFR